MRRSLEFRARAFGLLFPMPGAPIFAVLLATACVPNPQPLWPALTGEPDVRSTAGPYVPAAAATDWPAALSLNAGVFQPARLSALPTGDTPVAEALREARDDLAEIARSTAGSDRRLQQLRGIAADRSEDYVALAARIDRGLQSNPDAADPVLERRWRQALSALDRLAGDDPALVRLAGRIAADGEAAGEATQALRSEIDMTGASAGERTIRDVLLRDAETASEALAVMLSEAEQDLAAMRAYVAAERANLQILRLAIANGEPYGISLANRAVPDIAARPDRPRQPRPGDSPLVVIRFEDDDIRYEQPLYRAAALALERRADALFTLVAVGPESGLQRARDHAGEVRRVLAEMGLPDDQLTETDWSDSAALGAEVHLYVR